MVFNIYKYKLALLAVFLGFVQIAQAQFLAPADSLNQPRLVGVVGIGALGYGATIVGLNELWYKDYPRSDFHFFNDNESWLQMDKAGHALTTYQLGRYGYEAFRWTGMKEKNAVWIGGSFGLLFMTSIEIMDGFSSEWGFSSGDMIANAGGTALFIAQQAAWGEQRMALKFSYSKSDYAAYRPDVLGSGGIESALKDYNGQTIWLSVNPSSFSHSENQILPWLNIALGYGANGMLGGDANPFENESLDELPAFSRYRQLYLSLDVDLSRIKTNSHLLKTIFSVVGFVKIPAPAIELSQDKLNWHWLYF